MSDIPRPRWGHSTCAIQIGPTLTEVVIFGGRFLDTTLADTTVLQFSEWYGLCRMCVEKGGAGKCGRGEMYGWKA